MSELTVQGGSLVVRNGTLGTGQGCCCNSPPPPIDGGCCGWICEYVAEFIWPDIENPEDIPAIDTPDGWILMPGGVPGVGEYRKTINGVENCDDPEAVAAKVTELQADLDALVAGQGGHSQVSFDPDTSGEGCIPATEQECPDYAGTWYATLEECLENCNPLP